MVYTVCGLKTNDTVLEPSASFAARGDFAAYLAVSRLQLANEDILEVWEGRRLVWRFEAPRKLSAAVGHRSSTGMYLTNCSMLQQGKLPARLTEQMHAWQRRGDHAIAAAKALPAPVANAALAQLDASPARFVPARLDRVEHRKAVTATYASIERSKALLDRLKRSDAWPWSLLRRY